MSEEWEVTEEGTLMIKQNAAFNLRKLYAIFQTFAEENDYFFNEKNFTRKDKSDGSEFQIEWDLQRKVTPFIRFKITTEIWTLRTKEISKDEFKGELEMNFDSLMEMDWQERWEANAFTKFLRRIYIYYFKKQYFNEYAGKLWEEVYDLHARTKAVLNQFQLE
ncbi:MAG: hypothetical protein CMH64_00700 [Nanoarchaeota archaeon]|nr:hypothetical protein [Nanoarchaeota archaeon]|tara:strand:+ start:1355 stop:1843 length:489 start_codon:yes stop_codon:yes gene_type:complete